MFKKYRFQRYGTLVLIIMFAVWSAGCARLKAPHKKLGYSVYSPEGTAVRDGQYVIGARDTLEIRIWRCPELDSLQKVRPEDGNITIPLIGDVEASGLTPKELAKVISKRMAEYVKEPRVAVGVKSFGDKKVFVLGEVATQGTFRLDKNDRIIDLIGKAHGFTDAALPKCTYIIRGGYDDPKMIRVNLARLIHKGDITQNVYLMEGDIVYVPQSEIENLNLALRKIFPSMYFAERLATLESNIMAGQFDWAMVWRKMSGKK